MADKKASIFQKQGIDDFSVDWSAFRNKEIPEQKTLLTLRGEKFLREQMIAEIFAFRGIGKSAFMLALVRTLITGQSFLDFKSEGGNRVLLIDGELPEKMLQDRLNDLVGETPAGMLRIRSLKQTNGIMEPLFNYGHQRRFIDQLKDINPNVVIFDTKTATFKHDTNNPDHLLSVNTFLIELRGMGYTVITNHHAGKNGTQRGRTDNDDIYDLIMKLESPHGWIPGEKLHFDLQFEKVRYGDQLRGFGAKWSPDTGWQYADDRAAEVIQRLLEGESINTVARDMGLGCPAVSGIKKRAQRDGTRFPVNKPGKKAKVVSIYEQV